MIDTMYHSREVTLVDNNLLTGVTFNYLTHV